MEHEDGRQPRELATEPNVAQLRHEELAKERTGGAHSGWKQNLTERRGTSMQWHRSATPKRKRSIWNTTAAINKSRETCRVLKHLRSERIPYPVRPSRPTLRAHDSLWQFSFTGACYYVPAWCSLPLANVRRL